MDRLIAVIKGWAAQIFCVTGKPLGPSVCANCVHATKKYQDNKTRWGMRCYREDDKYVVIDSVTGEKEEANIVYCLTKNYDGYCAHYEFTEEQLIGRIPYSQGYQPKCSSPPPTSAHFEGGVAQPYLRPPAPPAPPARMFDSNKELKEQFDNLTKRLEAEGHVSVGPEEENKT